ncbi:MULTISPECIES: thymidylate synthase [Micromonospora]|uniref:thymidylate synthase n=1 Tax=Micromonospora TaxID=1873 RepID=UPI0033DDB66D
MLRLSATSANNLYVAVCREVMRQGQRVNPRGMATTEVIGAHLCLTEPRRRFVFIPPARVLNPAFAVAEALWILSGSDDPWIFTYNRSLKQYADNGRLRGAYGPRIRRWAGQTDQLDHVRTALSRDPGSRQAVIQIYDPQQDTLGHRDVPCTLNYRFFLRGGRLQMHTTMRSNDVWLGLPYDLFTATMLHELMAGWLGVKLGSYHHHVDSLHLYDQHAQSAADLVSSPVAPSPVMPSLAAPAEGTTEFLTSVVNDTAVTEHPSPWRDMAATLASYRRWSAGDRPAARETAATVEGDLGRALRDWYSRLSQPAAATGASR